MGNKTLVQWLRSVAADLAADNDEVMAAEVEAVVGGRVALRLSTGDAQLVCYGRAPDEQGAWLRTASAAWNMEPYEVDDTRYRVERLVRDTLRRRDPGQLVHQAPAEDRTPAPEERAPAPERLEEASPDVAAARWRVAVADHLHMRPSPAAAAPEAPVGDLPGEDQPVHIHTEWGPLREVIVGDSMNWNLEGFDELFQALYWENLQRSYQGPMAPEVHRRYIAERQADMDAFAETLRGLGVVVRRPERLEQISRIQTPTFEAITNTADAPRDMFMCLGDEIIETPPTDTNRYFLSYQLRAIFRDYFRRGARWTQAPRPMYDHHDPVSWRDVDELHGLSDIDPRLDIAFDAANCLKFGRDILMNVGNKHHELGATWLQRHLGDRYRVHRVRLTDYHIDGTLMPLKPGVLVVNPSLAARKHWLPEKLQKWTQIVVEADEEERFQYPAGHVQLASIVGMGVNVLSIDERRVCVRERNTTLRRRLERAGFEVIPIRLRHSLLFGGGLHCATLDVRRDDEPLSYL